MSWGDAQDLCRALRTYHGSQILAEQEGCRGKRARSGHMQVAWHVTWQNHPQPMALQLRKKWAIRLSTWRADSLRRFNEILVEVVQIVCSCPTLCINNATQNSRARISIESRIELATSHQHTDLQFSLHYPRAPQCNECLWTNELTQR